MDQPKDEKLRNHPMKLSKILTKDLLHPQIMKRMRFALHNLCLMAYSDRTYVGTGPGPGPEWVTILC